MVQPTGWSGAPKIRTKTPMCVDGTAKEDFKGIVKALQVAETKEPART